MAIRPYGSQNGGPPGADSQSTANATPATTRPSKEFTFDDLGLMHLFATTTCFSLAASDPKQQHAWQIAVPQEAQTQPYLMYGLLSLAALHRIHLENNTDSHALDSALDHYSLALSKSREALAHLSELNSSNLFALSLLIGYFALGLPISPASPPLSDAIGLITQVASVMRGALTIVLTQRESIENGPMSAMLRKGFSKNPAILPEELETSLDQLEADLYLTENAEDGLSAYRETFQGLKACFRNAGFSVDAPNGIPMEDQIIALSWLGVMHPDFVQLLSHRRPVALVLLSYYAIALHTLDAMWWCQGWSLMLVKDVYRSLDGSWRSRMEWPMRQINFKPDGIAAPVTEGTREHP